MSNRFVSYGYECEATGERRFELYPPGSAPKSLRMDGRMWVRFFGNQQKSGDPGFYSGAMGVHPSQIAEATKQSYADGYDTHFDPEGRMWVDGTSHCKRALKALGYSQMDRPRTRRPGGS